MVVQTDNVQSQGIPGMVLLNFASRVNIIYYDNSWKYDANIFLLSERRTHNETITLSSFKNRNEIVTDFSGVTRIETVKILNSVQSVIWSPACRIGTRHYADLRE